MLNLIEYKCLNSRQKENYNFQKIAAFLADYGFNCIRLTDDWEGADFIAAHIDGDTFLKVQIKGRLAIDKKYLGKNIFISFLDGKDAYLYNHDDLVEYLTATGRVRETSESWGQKGFWHWSTLPKWALAYLQDYKISR